MKRNEFIASLQRNLKDPEVTHTRNHAILIGRLPKVGPEAYLHTVFPGIQEDLVRRLGFDTGVALPKTMQAFLSEFNGIKLFQSALSVHGLLVGGLLSRDPNYRQPYDLASHNSRGTMIDARPGDFCIGGYRWDGSFLFLEGEKEEVLRRPRDRRVVLNRWPNIWTLLESEVARIGALYDEGGDPRDPENPTIPEITDSVVPLTRR